MPLKSRTYECPDCTGQFTLLLDDRDPLPTHCPLCGADVSQDAEPIPNFSRISRPQNQSYDNVYRAMESTSAARAKEAADIAGVPESEMSHLKVTNMGDSRYQGDTSFIPPSPPQTRISQPVPNAPMMNGSAGLATASMIRSQGGSVGQSVMDKFRGDHTMRAKAMERAGNMGAFAAK